MLVHNALCVEFTVYGQTHKAYSRADRSHEEIESMIFKISDTAEQIIINTTVVHSEEFEENNLSRVEDWCKKLDLLKLQINEPV